MAERVPPDERRYRRALFVLSASIFLALGAGSITVSDGAAMYETTRSIVERGDLVVSPDHGVPGRVGPVAKYGLGLPVVSLPAYVLARPFAVASEHREVILQAAVAATMAFISAALVVAMFALARRLGASRRSALVVSLGGTLGTFMLPYTRSFFSEPLAALGIVLAIERLLAGRHRASGAWLALAIVTRPQTIVLAPLFALVAARRSGLRAGMAASLGPVMGVGVLIAHNVWRFGEAATTGYEDGGFSTPLWYGARELLTHPDKSLLLFAPVLVLAIPAMRRADRHARALALGTLGATFLTAATWWSWTGGWSWGPRLLLPAVPPLLALIAPWLDAGPRRARAALALLAVGFVVSAPAMIVGQRAQQIDPERAGSRIAPSVLRQYELIAPTLARTAADAEGLTTGDSRLYVEAWQANAIAAAGGGGVALALMGTAALAGLAVSAGRSMRPARPVPMAVTTGARTKRGRIPRRAPVRARAAASV